MTNTYVRRPETFEAIQFTGDNADEVVAALEGNAFIRNTDNALCIVVMLGSVRVAEVGDYIFTDASAVFDEVSFNKLFTEVTESN